MTEQQIQTIVNTQRRYFRAGATLPVCARMQALARLKKCILAHEQEISAALQADLGKSSFESYMCETGLVLSEITYMLRHVRTLAREKTVATPLAQFHSRSYKKPSPYGVVLIMSPWNYPFLLTMDPLVDAIAAGNTVVLKPSAYSPHTSRLIARIVEQCFSPELVAVVTGGREENTCLLRQRFDYLFFTGSQSVGREVMKQAAAHLTPVTLELGGKSPCIVDRTASLKLAARRIVFGKFLNCGQTCVAPDYIYCDETIRDRLVTEIRREITRQLGRNPLARKDYGKIINEKHFHRLLNLIDYDKVTLGGTADIAGQRIAPTLMEDVTFSDKVMQEEIFGPVLPVLTFRSLGEAVRTINSRPSPLALYLFTRDRTAARKVMARCGFGGGCINDTVIHLATSHMGFGGFGESGMGTYHGKDGFDTFSHYKSIVDKKLWLDLPMRYQPYRKIYDKLIHLFLQ